MDKAHKTYQKPAGIKYTDMAIYIDKHSYDENRSEEVDALIYEYLYHLVYALSLKKNYFKNYQDYDSFSCYGAMRVFSRLINKNQFREEKPLKKIKSVLNYIKSVLYAFKTDYQKENYVEILNPELGTDTFQLQEDINDSIQSSYSYNKEEDVKELLTQGFEIIKKIVYNTPYKNTPYTPPWPVQHHSQHPRPPAPPCSWDASQVSSDISCCRPRQIPRDRI